MSPLKNGRKLIINSKEQAHFLNNQLCSVFSPSDTVTAEEFTLCCLPQQNLLEYTDCKDIHITEEGMKTFLLKLDPNKACGPDGVTPRLMKTVLEEVTPAIALPKLLPDWNIAT